MTATPLAPVAPDTIEQVLLGGDLARLAPAERLAYYRSVCESLGLNPLTRPFDYIALNGKLTLYAKRDATDQLRKRDRISVEIVDRAEVGDVYVVRAKATTPDGRTDESLGAVPKGRLTGEALANALMKCETKAKRRVTLSICGLGWLDETELDTIPSAEKPVTAVASPANALPAPPSATETSRRVPSPSTAAPRTSGFTPVADLIPAPPDRAYTLTALDELKSGVNDCGPWTLYRLTVEGLGDVTTLEPAQVNTARTALQSGQAVHLAWTEEKKGRFTNRRLTAIRLADDDAPADDEPPLVDDEDIPF